MVARDVSRAKLVFLVHMCFKFAVQGALASEIAMSMVSERAAVRAQVTSDAHRIGRNLGKDAHPWQYSRPMAIGFDVQLQVLGGGSSVPSRYEKT
eukprot:1150580-Pelagomonas_calceolata.AAC.13